MWSRVRKERIKRYAQVRLRIHRRDPIQRSPGGGRAVKRSTEEVSRRMPGRMQRIGRMVRRIARNGLASYLRRPVPHARPERESQG
jgi:hypothetical protein